MTFKNAINCMLIVVPEVSEMNEFEKILKHTPFKNPYEKKKAKKDYENLLKIRDKLTSEDDTYCNEWLTKVSYINLLNMFTSNELLKNIIVFMNMDIDK